MHNVWSLCPFLNILNVHPVFDLGLVVAACSETGLPTVMEGEDIASVKSGIFYWFYNEQTNC